MGRKEDNKKYYQANKKKILVSHKEYYEKNKEKIREIVKSWRAKNKVRMRDYRRNYKQTKDREKNLIRNRTNKILQKLGIDKSKIKCNCGTMGVEVHHTTIPYEVDEFELLCKKCHNKNHQRGNY